MSLIEFTDKGLYCPAGNFYIDPWKPVPKAIITHAHSDHARPGSEYYLCHHQTLPVLKFRLGDIRESTFGLPVYRWKQQETLFRDIQEWIGNNQANGKTSVITAYSLGKAQRVLQCIAAVTENIFVHGAIWNIHQVLQEAGLDLPPVKRVNPEIPRSHYDRAVIIAPPSADGTPWMKRFTPYSVGICSGWMQVRGHVRRRNADAGFALSDHADWNGLLQAVKATGAEKVFVTHGFQSAFSRYLTEQGIDAAEVKTAYGS